MADQDSLLVELGCEELPAGSVLPLAESLAAQLRDALENEAFVPGTYEVYATPRRIAVCFQSVKACQDDREIERRGPAVQMAFDEVGNPKPAATGFAKSCGVEVADLERITTDKGEWLYFKTQQKGETLSTTLPAMLEQVLASMPMPKRMRWSDLEVEFLRPVHWIMVLHGERSVVGEVMGLAIGRCTRGHRFHAPEFMQISSAEMYAKELRDRGKVIANFAHRRAEIVRQVNNRANELNATAVMDESLVDEVTALVEWPVAIAGTFEQEYLEVPKEALIQTMQDNQRYFPLLGKDGCLKAGFITVANIESLNPKSVRQGNERVIRPRLADARFFWQQDQKQKLESRMDSLKKVVFQKKLGTLYDKTERLIALAENIAETLGFDQQKCKRAARLAKCDLMTEMVFEFAKMQGIAGRYYAELDGEDNEVCNAIEEQYLPKQAGDKTPSSRVGQVLAIADKIDTVAGIIGIGQLPTGTKDPFALRRTALGLLRIIIENKLELDLSQLLSFSKQNLGDKLAKPEQMNEALDYILERLKSYYQEQSISFDVVDAVMAKKPTRPLDFDNRIKAVNKFRALPEARSLASANKRIRNILKKSKAQNLEDNVDEALLVEVAEKQLNGELGKLIETVEPLQVNGDYETALKMLEALRDPVDVFFDQVMVMTEDESIRNNRLALLNKVAIVCSQVADISRLQLEA